MQRGEIWWASLPVPQGSEPGYRSPVLIIQADSFNRSKINTLICAVITSNINLTKAPGNLFLAKETSSLPKDSVINISQIVTLDKLCLSEYVKTLNPKALERIQGGLKLVLGLSGKTGAD